MITIISPHMGNNALGRALVLAQVAESMGRRVRILGSTRPGDAIWAPMRPYVERYGVRTFPLYRTQDYPAAARALGALIKEHTGPVIVSKPLPTSLGLAMMAGVSPWGPGVILDIDDWELGFRLKGDEDAFKGPQRAARMVLGSVPLTRLNTDLGVLMSEQVARSAPHKIVSNSWLRARFGGALLPHVRDAQVLAPGRASQGERVREELGMDTTRLWLGFIGTPRAHKGVDVLIEALARIPRATRPGLVLFGCTQQDEVSERLWQKACAQLGEDAVRRKGHFAFEALAEHVAAVDVVVIPSLLTTESVGQIPAKLFDAMAMSKPIIVSDVNDMGSIIKGVGEVVTPGDAQSLRRAIETIAGERAEDRARRGALARERFLRHYTLESGASTLATVLEDACP